MVQRRRKGESLVANVRRSVGKGHWEDVVNACHQVNGISIVGSILLCDQTDDRCRNTFFKLISW